MSSTRGIAPPPSPPRPYKKQKQPSSPPIEPKSKRHAMLTGKPWPVPPLIRKSWAASLASVLSWPAFGLQRREEAEVITEKIEDEAYKEADAVADISPEERKSMYTDLMFSQIEKYHLSESEFSAKLESDPPYSVFRPTANWWEVQYDPGLPDDRALYKPQIDQAQLQTLYAKWLADYLQQPEYSGFSSHESLGAMQAISSEQAQLQTPHVPSWLTTSSDQRQDSGMSSHDSLEAIQAILIDKGKLGQVLLQNPNLLKVLQEKLEQLR